MLFGNLDSYGGNAIPKHLQKNLFDNILNEGGIWLDLTNAMHDIYLFIDDNILE